MENKDKVSIEPIAYIRTDFSEKFGIPRQSGLVEKLTARVVFLPEYRIPEAFRDIEGFSHIWLFWRFTEAVNGGWRPTVRPPRLGGNRRVGVFASRSPFRPNFLGLSCVKLLRVEYDAADGPALLVSGADILDNTPIYDVKPYVPLTDCRMDASEGYTLLTKTHKMEVEIPEELLLCIPEDKREALFGILSEDPRPGYDDSPDKTYGLTFSGLNVGFRVEDGKVCVFRIENTERKI